MYQQAGMNPQLLGLLLQMQAQQQLQAPQPSLGPQLPQSQPRNAAGPMMNMAPAIPPSPPGGTGGAASPFGQLMQSPVLAQWLRNQQLQQNGGSTGGGLLGNLSLFGQSSPSSWFNNAFWNYGGGGGGGSGEP